jgi:hypothetical protein
LDGLQIKEKQGKQGLVACLFLGILKENKAGWYSKNEEEYLQCDTL